MASGSRRPALAVRPARFAVASPSLLGEPKLRARVTSTWRSYQTVVSSIRHLEWAKSEGKEGMEKRTSRKVAMKGTGKRLQCAPLDSSQRREQLGWELERSSGAIRVVQFTHRVLELDAIRSALSEPMGGLAWLVKDAALDARTNASIRDGG